MGGWSERTQGQATMAAWNSFSYICTRALHAFRSFIVAQPPPSFLFCLTPPSHRQSSLTSVSLVPVPHWLRPSTPFWPYDTHPFFPHAQTIPIHSDLLYSLSISALRTSSFLTLSIRDTPSQTSQTLHLKNIHFPSLTLLIPHASAPYNTVGTITPSYRHFLAFIPSPILLRTLFSAPQA